MTVLLPALALGIAVAIFVAVTGFTLAYFGWTMKLDPVVAGLLIVTGFLGRDCWEVVRS